MRLLAPVSTAAKLDHRPQSALLRAFHRLHCVHLRSSMLTLCAPSAGASEKRMSAAGSWTAEEDWAAQLEAAPIEREEEVSAGACDGEMRMGNG